MRGVASLCVLAAATSACANNPPASDTRTRIAQIAGDCGLPVSSMQLQGENELLFRPPADAPYESVDCALEKLRPLNLRMGFVGNEAFVVPGADNAAR